MLSFLNFTFETSERNRLCQSLPLADVFLPVIKQLNFYLKKMKNSINAVWNKKYNVHLWKSIFYMPLIILCIPCRLNIIYTLVFLWIRKSFFSLIVKNTMYISDIFYNEIFNYPVKFQMTCTLSPTLQIDLHS